MGKIKNTNKKKRNAQSAPINNGYKIMPPFAFGFNEWAIMPCIPILSNVKIVPEAMIKNTVDSDSRRPKR